MTIAHKLSARFDISVMHPAEWNPFPINLLPKYKNIAGRQCWEDDGITIRPFKYIRLIGTNNAFKLLPRYNKKNRGYCQRFGIPQLVHANYALPDGYFAYQILKNHNVPYIISFRKTDIKFLQTKKNSSTQKMIQTVLENASQIVVHNAAQQEYVSNEGFNSIIVPHGIEEEFIVKKTTENLSGTLSIASIGELIPQKHIDWVINAVKNYKGDKNITLTIAGDGPMRKELDLLAQGNNSISLLGKVSHEKVGELLCQSDIFALPSYNETFGLVYMEATAHQNAVIATRGTGIWGVFKDNDEMLYCDSYESFQAQLYELIENDSFRNNIAKKSFEKTSTCFTWDKVIKRYVEIYNDCIGDK